MQHRKWHSQKIKNNNNFIQYRENYKENHLSNCVKELIKLNDTFTSPTTDTLEKYYGFRLNSIITWLSRLKMSCWLSDSKTWV